jgi:hypothetical protein
MSSSEIGITILQLQNYLLVPNLIYYSFFMVVGWEGVGMATNSIY